MTVLRVQQVHLVTGDPYPDEKRCVHQVYLSWSYPGYRSSRGRVRCRRKRGHAGRTHAGYIETWALPGIGVRVLVRWVG